MAVEKKARFTYEHYQNLPPSDTKRYELIDGDLIMVPAPTRRYQRVVLRTGAQLDGHVRSRGLGEVLIAPFDVHLGDEVVQPDIVYVGRQRLHIVTEKELTDGPDLVIEVLSPDTRGRDRTYKRRLYFRHGVLEYWLMDSKERSVEVLGRGESDFERIGLYRHPEVVRSQVLPELELRLGEVFGDG